MKSENFDPKIIIASALIGSSLFANSPVIRENPSRVENSIFAARQQRSIKLKEQLCNHQFICNQIGLIVYFLSNSKVQLFDLNTVLTLQGDYRVQFNKDIVVNVYKNPSESFDFLLRDIALGDQGFSANINSVKRYFQPV